MVTIRQLKRIEHTALAALNVRNLDARKNAYYASAILDYIADAARLDRIVELGTSRLLLRSEPSDLEVPTLVDANPGEKYCYTVYMDDAQLIYLPYKIINQDGKQTSNRGLFLTCCEKDTDADENENKQVTGYIPLSHIVTINDGGA